MSWVLPKKMPPPHHQAVFSDVLTRWNLKVNSMEVSISCTNNCHVDKCLYQMENFPGAARLALLTTLWDKYYFYPHFMDRKTKLPSVNSGLSFYENLSKVTIPILKTFWRFHMAFKASVVSVFLSSWVTSFFIIVLGNRVCSRHAQLFVVSYPLDLGPDLLSFYLLFPLPVTPFATYTPALLRAFRLILRCPTGGAFCEYAVEGSPPHLHSLSFSVIIITWKVTYTCVYVFIFCLFPLELKLHKNSNLVLLFSFLCFIASS